MDHTYNKTRWQDIALSPKYPNYKQVGTSYQQSQKETEENNRGLWPEDGEGSGTHSSTLAWKIPWTEEPGGLQSMGSLRVGHYWATSLSLFTFMHWRRKCNPLQCSCLENPRDGGACWAAVYGVAQSRTRLKRLRERERERENVCMSVPVSQFVPPCPAFLPVISIL